MQRLVYAPKAFVYTKDSTGTIYDLTNFVTSGNVDRKLNQVSTASVTLRNPKKRFTTPSQGVSFHPQDPITIYLQRIQGCPVRVFTGYLDDTPYYQLYPGTITLAASCTLKRLLYSFFDPSLPYVIAFFEKYGWINTGSGSLISSQSYNSKQVSTQSEVNAGAKPFTALQDGSLGKLLWAVLYEIGQWDDANIYIENLPSGPNGIPARMATLMQSMQQAQQQASTEFTLFLESVVGTSSQGSGGGAGNTSGGASSSTTLVGNSNAQQIFNYFQPLVGAYGAAGMLGNMGQEVGGNTLNIPISNQPAGGAIGIVQWTPASSGPAAGSSLLDQLNFLWHEINTGYSSMIPQLQHATSATDAATIFCHTFEEPQVSIAGSYGPQVYLEHRQALAEAAYSQYNNISTTNITTGNNPRGIAVEVVSGKSTTPGDTSAYYTSPFPGGSNGASVRQLQRTDQGVDWDLGPIGSDIVAIGNGNVLGTSRTGWPGPNSPNNFMWYQLTDGPLSGSCIYYAEGISPSVGNGPVKKGQTIAKVADQSSGVEFGYCDVSGEQLGASEGFNGVSATPAGNAFARLMRTLGVKTLSNPGAGSIGPPGGPGAIVAGTQPGSNASAGGSTATKTSDQAFVAQLEFPSVEDQITAIALGAEGKGLMHDQSLMPFMQQLTQASLRSFQSLPNGDFYAFYPDYFGEMGTSQPYWLIDDIEILNGGINLTDAGLATHVFSVGDNSWPVNNELVNELFSAGTITVYNAFLGNLVNTTNQTTASASKGNAKGNQTSASANQDPGANLSGNIMTQDEAVKFVERYGARPLVQDYPMVRSAIYEMLLAYQQFITAWSSQFETPFSFTFMPEVFPGGKVAFKNHGLQMYVNEVVHSWDYAEAGFTTTATLSAPSIYGNFNPDLPPNMVQALVEPIRGGAPGGTTPKNSTDVLGVTKQQVQTINQGKANQLEHQGS